MGVTGQCIPINDKLIIQSNNHMANSLMLFYIEQDIAYISASVELL